MRPNPQETADLLTPTGEILKILILNFIFCTVLHVLFLGDEKSENNYHYHHLELPRKQSRVSTTKR